MGTKAAPTPSPSRLRDTPTRGAPLSLPPVAGPASPGRGVQHEDAGGAGDGAAGLLGDVDALGELRKSRGEPSPPAPPAPRQPPQSRLLTASLMILVMTALGRFKSSGLSAIAAAPGPPASSRTAPLRAPDFPRRRRLTQTGFRPARFLFPIMLRAPPPPPPSFPSLAFSPSPFAGAF